MKINLDFRYYSPRLNQEKFYEVEAQECLGDRFVYGYATTEFPDFLIYLAALASSRKELPFSKEPEFVLRFHSSFPEKGKIVASVVLGLNGLRSEILEELVESIQAGHILVGKQLQYEREKQFLVIRGD